MVSLKKQNEILQTELMLARENNKTLKMMNIVILMIQCVILLAIVYGRMLN